MIEKTVAIETFQVNLERTNMLIEAMEKIKAYNWIYQNNTYEKNIEFGKIVKNIQNDQLWRIEKSCSQHAIISLTTLFETFYKELLQQMLYEYPNYFQNITTQYSSDLNDLINEKTKYDYEEIEKRLNLKNRFDYYKFFKKYNIQLLTAKESELVEYIYIYRNCFVHNAGKIDNKTKAKLSQINSPVKETEVTTIAKRLRTKMEKLIPKIKEKVFSKLC